ncbi:MAG: periplasmic heavy metal sensor [Vicinamibacteraceae bacterium]|nr:periplasmic heavy metal sensor [Vicinamibacteraceae bacterium]
MNIKSLIVLALIGVLTLGAAAPSGASDRKWWMSERVKGELSLTEQQSREIEAIFQATVPQLRAQKAELDRLEKQVSDLLSGPGLSEAEFAAALDRAEAARGALNKSRMLMLFRMRRVLSADQRSRLRLLHERQEQERRERRPNSSAARPE